MLRSSIQSGEHSLLGASLVRSHPSRIFSVNANCKTAECNDVTSRVEYAPYVCFNDLRLIASDVVDQQVVGPSLDLVDKHAP